MAKKEQKKFQDKLTEPSPKKRTSKKNPNKIGTSNAIKPSLLFEQIFNENDFCFVWLSDNKLLKKINCSENVLKITGFSNKELNNLPGAHHFLIHDKDRRKIQDELSAFFKNEKEKTISLTYRIINKEKKIVWIKEKIFVYCDDKKKSLILKGAAYDISDLKNSEHLFSNKIEKLEDINSSKDIFISKLSHDLRSPYTSILGFLEILMSEPGLSDADKLEYLNYIYASAEKQLRFINCLLDWSRLKTGTIDYKPQRIKVLYTIYNCVAALTHIAVRKNIEVKINVNESLYVY
ncbi:MAG: PAS domain-containing sensor histidine kinase, partial [Ignavibacteriaceae bacterium]